jgi:serine/threonine-protein kinase RsbW
MTVPMLHSAELVAAEAVRQIAENMEFDHKAIDEIRLAIIEACINAREHSGCADNRMYLRFVGTSEGGPRIDIWITDHGRGFDPGEARARRQKLGAAHKRGWGLQIIEAHMDEVDITTSAHGTTIHMVKREKNDHE